jgi:hypothetical protein
VFQIATCVPGEMIVTPVARISRIEGVLGEENCGHENFSADIHPPSGRALIRNSAAFGQCRRRDLRCGRRRDRTGLRHCGERRQRLDRPLLDRGRSDVFFNNAGDASTIASSLLPAE